jgi:CRISPR-associated protein Cas5t
VEALAHPQAVSRFGGLSLGESTHLVDEIRLGRDGELRQGQLLVQDPQGDLALPVWPDHVGSAGTRWAQYRLVDGALGEPLPEAAWTAITPPEAT